MKSLFKYLKNISSWVIDYISKFKSLVYEKKFSLLIGLIVFFTLFIIFVKLYKDSENVTNLASMQSKRNQVISHELNYFHSVLESVETNPFNTKQQKTALQSLEKDIDSVQKSLVGVAKSKELKDVSKQISTVKEDMDFQMSTIKKAISENSENKEYLDASALPFNVIAVDVIAGQSYITVDYANHVFPLSIGDLIAGWRAYRADYDSGIAEFINVKNQYVKINLHGA